MSLGIVSSVATALFFLMVSPILAGLLGCPSLASHAAPIAVWIVLLAFSQIIAEAFRGIHDLRAASLLAGISGGLLANIQFLVAIVVLDQLGALTYSSTIWAAVGSFAIPAIGGGLWLMARWTKAPVGSSPAPSIATDEWNRAAIDSGTLTVLAQAVPIMLVNLIALGFDQAGQLIAQHSGSASDVAVFEAVWRLAMIGIVPLTMLGLAVASTMAEMHSLGRMADLQKLVRGVSTLSTLITVPALVVLIVFAGPALNVIFGANYSVGTVALTAIGLVQIVRNWLGPCDTLLVMTGHQRAAFACFLLAAPILAFGPYAVSQFGVSGIGVVIAVAVLTSRFLQYVAVRKYLSLRPHADFRPLFLRSVVKFLFAPRPLAASP
jgi:O-antigen/teichoic acid export membrane protein